VTVRANWCSMVDKEDVHLVTQLVPDLRGLGVRGSNDREEEKRHVAE